MTGERLNFTMARILPTLKPDLSGLKVSPSGEVIKASVQEPAAGANVLPVSAEAGRDI
jgi:hypothetical protein